MAPKWSKVGAAAKIGAAKAGTMDMVGRGPMGGSSATRTGNAAFFWQSEFSFLAWKIPEEPGRSSGRSMDTDMEMEDRAAAQDGHRCASSNFGK